MRKMDICWLAIACAVFVGCHNTTKTDEYHGDCIDTICCKNVGEAQWSQYVEDISFLRLKNSDSHPIAEATKVLANDKAIFLYSKKFHRIAAYGLDGEFMYEINRRGHGNNEYMEIANCCVNDRNVYIVDNVRHCVVIYDAATGAYRDKRPLSFNAWDMECLSDNEFLFTCLPNNPDVEFDMVQPKVAVWKTDSTFVNILHEYFPYSKDYCEMVGKHVYFTRSGKNIVFHSFQNRGCFIFRPNSDDLQYIDFIASHPIPAGKAYTYDEIMKREYAYLSDTPFVTERYICFDVGCGAYSETYLMSRQEKRIYRDKEDEDSKNTLLTPSLVIGDAFVFYLYDYDLYESLISSGFKRADDETEETLKKGGCCLIMYAMK